MVSLHSVSTSLGRALSPFAYYEDFFQAYCIPGRKNLREACEKTVSKTKQTKEPTEKMEWRNEVFWNQSIAWESNVNDVMGKWGRTENRQLVISYLKYPNSQFVLPHDLTTNPWAQKKRHDQNPAHSGGRQTNTIDWPKRSYFLICQCVRNIDWKKSTKTRKITSLIEHYSTTSYNYFIT